MIARAEIMEISCSADLPPHNTIIFSMPVKEYTGE
jgi:hypothetical protein